MMTYDYLQKSIIEANEEAKEHVIEKLRLENQVLKDKVKDLEERHWGECIQISQYQQENEELKQNLTGGYKEAEKLKPCPFCEAIPDMYPSNISKITDDGRIFIDWSIKCPGCNIIKTRSQCYRITKHAELCEIGNMPDQRKRLIDEWNERK